jgi:hypothetical protein
MAMASDLAPTLIRTSSQNCLRAIQALFNFASHDLVLPLYHGSRRTISSHLPLTVADLTLTIPSAFLFASKTETVRPMPEKASPSIMICFIAAIGDLSSLASCDHLLSSKFVSPKPIRFAA